MLVGDLIPVTYLVMLLWNAIVPDIFNVGTIGYWQTMGLLVLAKIFFGFGGGGSKSKRRWRRDIPQEHWAAMTPEEKEKFRQEWRTRCGGWYDSKKYAQPPQQQAPPASETGTQSA